MATEAERLKAEVNTFFQTHQFFPAEKYYRQAIVAAPPDNPKLLVILYTNFSTAQHHIEKCTEDRIRQQGYQVRCELCQSLRAPRLCA
jgi:hypothetical protein